MRSPLRILAIIALSCLWPVPGTLLSQEPGVPRGAWFRVPGDVRGPCADGGGSMEIWAVTGADPEGSRFVHVRVYPDPGTRVFLESGTGISDGTGRVIFRRNAGTRTRLLPRPEGFPVSSRLDMQGTFSLKEVSRHVMSVVPGAPGQGSVLVVDGVAFRAMEPELRRLSGRNDPGSARDFARLFHAAIYTAMSRVQGLGGVGVIGLRQDVPGLAAGVLSVEFQARGVLGLGNSGVLFTARGAGDFPGMVLDGSIFGGISGMEGILDLSSVEDNGSKILLGRMDFHKVRLSEGICAGGSFLVETGGYPETWIPVAWNLVAP